MNLKTNMAPLALAVMTAISAMSVSATDFINPDGDLIDYRYTDTSVDIGRAVGTSGKLVIDGGGDVTTDYLGIGNFGTGVLDIINGGKLTVLGGTRMGGEEDLEVGLDGELNRIPSRGADTVNISGAGSQFDTASLLVGTNSGTGNINISEGGKMTVSGDINLAEGDSYSGDTTKATGNITVNGNGSSLVANGIFNIGYAADSSERNSGNKARSYRI